MIISVALSLLRLTEFNHVVVRVVLGRSFYDLGGGTPATVMRRYGDRKIVKSMIVDNVLFIYVE